jgi:hypothetical protein
MLAPRHFKRFALSGLVVFVDDLMLLNFHDLVQALWAGVVGVSHLPIVQYLSNIFSFK